MNTADLLKAAEIIAPLPEDIKAMTDDEFLAELVAG